MITIEGITNEKINNCNMCNCEIDLLNTYVYEDFGDEKIYCEDCIEKILTKNRLDYEKNDIAMELITRLRCEEFSNIEELKLLGDFDHSGRKTFEYKGEYIVLFDTFGNSYEISKVIDEPFCL